MDEILVDADLRDKLKSKMDVAKFFAGFISLVAGIALRESAGSVAANLGLALIVLSLGLAVATLFAYDRLLMPPRFWFEPPTDTHELNFGLRDEMISVWRCLFIPCVIAFFGGLLLLLAEKANSCICVVLLAGSVVAPYVVYRSVKPRFKIFD